MFVTVGLYLTDVKTWFERPTKSTSKKFNSIFTGLFEPCFSVILDMCSGSMDTKFIRASPVNDDNINNLRFVGFCFKEEVTLRHLFNKRS